MLPEREEGLLGPVAGGRKAIGPEADPGEERDQRDVVEDAGIADVLGRPEEYLAESAERTSAWRRCRRLLPSARIHRREDAIRWRGKWEVGTLPPYWHSRK